jgi:spore maturation protein CgeB
MKRLRIFYASDTTPNAWFRDVKSNIWRNNLFLPLVDMGHEVVEFDYDLTATFRNLDAGNPRQAAFIAENRPRLSRELLRQIQTAHAIRPVDLFFSYFYDACVLPETIDAIRAMGITAVNWYCNGSYQLDLVKEISPRYDFCLVPEKFRMEDYRELGGGGARPIYCQEAANPAIYRPYDVPRIYDVTFVGQAYGERPMMIGALLRAGIKVEVWGHGWVKPHAGSMGRETLAAIEAIPAHLRHEPVSDEEMVRMYSRSKINLGFSLCDTQADGRRIEQLRLRDFEVPMAGGFYMTGEMEELADFFVPGREVVCYRGVEDLVEKCRHYLARDGEREAIARAGRERALREHTWQERFRAAFAEMGLG